MTRAGAAPKHTMSDKESYSAPNALCGSRDSNAHARAEADAAEPSPPRQAVALVDTAQNAPRDQACHLDAGHVRAPGRTQPQRVALVLQGRFIERGIDEAPWMVPA